MFKLARFRFDLAGNRNDIKGNKKHNIERESKLSILLRGNRGKQIEEVEEVNREKRE